MRRFGWIGVFLVLVLTLVSGSIGYQLGMSHAVDTAVAAGGANVTYVVNAGGGFPFLPLLFGFLLFMLVVGFIRRASWRGRRDWYAMQMHATGRSGGNGPAGWGGPGSWCAQWQGGPGSTGEAGGSPPTPPSSPTQPSSGGAAA